MTEVLGDGEPVHLGETLVNADVAKLTVEEAQADGSAVVDGLKLRLLLVGAQVDLLGRFLTGGGGEEEDRLRLRHSDDELVEVGWGNRVAVKTTLAEVAALPEKHVCLGFGFDTLGHGDEAEAIAESDDGGDDLAALAGVDHGLDEAGFDFNLVEGEGLEVMEAGVAGPEVIECEAGAKFFEVMRDDLRLRDIVD